MLIPRNAPHATARSAPKRRRARAAAALLVLGLSSLTGCADSGDALGSPAPTSTEELFAQALANRAQFWGELDDMEKALGGEWTKIDGRTPEDCLGKFRGDHYQYLGFRERTVPVDDIHASADAMQKYWDDLDYTTQRISYAEDHLLVVAKDLNGWEITMKTEGLGDSKRTIIDAETGCFPGDYSTVLVYIVEWNKNHPETVE